MKYKYLLIVVLLSWTANGYSSESDSKLIATAGLTQLEGSGGGGIVPWATISGYETRDGTSFTLSNTYVDLDDFRLSVQGISFGLYDRVELSYARQSFDIKPNSSQIQQDVFAIKARLYGDLIYSKWPQISIGLQHKELLNGEIADALGAHNSNKGTDVYLAATKAYLGLVSGHNLVWNITARSSSANQLGLLGFGAHGNSQRKIQFEASLALFLSHQLAAGFEYRQKADNLNLGEDDWQDIFVTYIPNKNFNVTLAWANLGNIAGAPDQNGIFLSATGYLK